jgi:Tol biopolymer transport system component
VVPGRSLVYTCRIGANAEDVCVIGSGGGTPRQLTKDPARDILPSWSRDGKRIYFASDRSGTFQTWKIAADGSAPAVQVTRNGGFGGVESADGRFLFYGKAILSSPIYRVPVQGGDEVPVGDGVRSLRLPLNFAVNEDGIIFASSNDMTRRFELRRYLLASGKTELIIRIERGLGNGISLSPDGRSLLFTTMELRSGDLFMVQNFR